MIRCSKCKNTIDESDAVLGGYICKSCGRFNPKKESIIQCLEKPAKRNLDFKKIVKQIGKGVDMLKRYCK
jgi:DNA-directed RNA polymerase subunit RPC12/RpoP